MINISVIIPAYNAANTIVDALDSIFSQTFYQAISEIIIINDGSTDNTFNIVSSYKQKLDKIDIIKIINQENQGVSKTRNNGIRMASSDWIALLDSDDVWLPCKIEKQIKIIEKYQNVDFVGTGSNYGTSIIKGQKIDVNIFQGTIKSFCLKYYPVTPSALFRKSVFNDIGGFDESMRYGEDGEYFSRILCNYNYYYIAENLVDCGHGKAAFGETGLSSHVNEMYKSNIEIINRLKQKKKINLGFYLFLRFWYKIKQIRRKLLVGNKK